MDDLKKLFTDKELIKWLINQGVSFVILTAFTASFMYLSFTYVPQFVGQVGNLAASTAKIDDHLASIVIDTSDIKDTNIGIEKKVVQIEKTVIENNVLLRTLVPVVR